MKTHGFCSKCKISQHHANGIGVPAACKVQKALGEIIVIHFRQIDGQVMGLRLYWSAGQLTRDHVICVLHFSLLLLDP